MLFFLIYQDNLPLPSLRWSTYHPKPTPKWHWTNYTCCQLSVEKAEPDAWFIIADELQSS